MGESSVGGAATGGLGVGIETGEADVGAELLGVSSTGFSVIVV
jgi:hypothetical protein